jgi:hypothetical protein
MHPILGGQKGLGTYLAAWIPAALLLAALVQSAGRASWTEALVLTLPLAVVYAFQCLPIRHLCKNFPLRAPGTLRTVTVMCLAAILSASLWLLMGRAWALMLSRTARFASISEMFRMAYPQFFAAGMALFALTAAACYLLLAAEETRATERQALELKVLAKEAEVRALKAQINPHFLFNSLNSVVALIGSDDEEARRMCLLLSDFLRRILGSAPLDAIPLSDELALLDDFLAIERIRFRSRLRVRIATEGECGSCRVPPLLLQPLVENAIRHGISGLVDGGEIVVQARCSGTRLTVRVTNPCDPARPRSRGAGIGLKNVQARLAALFGSDARLDSAERDGEFAVELRLPAIRSQAAGTGRQESSQPRPASPSG